MTIAGIENVKRFTDEEIERLISSGAFEHPERFELLDGYIVEKMGQNDPHAWVLSAVNRALNEILFGTGLYVTAGVPVKLGGGRKPEPDVLVQNTTSVPTRANTVLIVEVSDTSLANDRGIKSRLYAEAGIPEYWIVDVNARRLEVYRQPLPDGTWASAGILAETLSIAPLCAPDHDIPIASILPVPGESLD